jgi:hypothetical protein
VLVHETSGYVYINSKNGNSWIEVSDAGVDVYTANSISMRAEKDCNIHADRDILLNAGGNIRMRAGSNITMMSGGDIQQQANGKLNLNAAGNIELTTTCNILNIAGNSFQVTAALGDLIMSVGGTGSLSVASDLQIKTGGNLRMQSTLQTSQLAGGQQLRDGAAILDNTGKSPAATPDTPIELTPPLLMPGLVHGDAKQKTINNNPPFWRGGGGQVTSIVSRLPTHEPWRDHPNANVPPPPTDCVEVTDNGTYDVGSPAPSSATIAPTTNPDGTLNDTGCSPGVAGTRKISTDVYNAIMNACTKTGADPATMLAFADLESGFQPGIRAGTSSATGLYQFVSGTWNAMVKKYGSQYNVGYDQINDAQANALMGGQFMCDNVAILKRKGIDNPTPGQIYIVHFAGTGGGPAMILAAQKTPDADAASLFPAAAAANRNIFQGKTIAQAVAALAAKADARAAAYAGQYGLPAPCDRAAAGTPAQPLNPTTTAAAELTAPTPINLHTQPAASMPSAATEGGSAVTPPPPPAVPVGGTGSICQAGTNPLAAGKNGYVGANSQPASLVTASGAGDPSTWRKGSTDPTTWVKNQPIAIFNDDGTYHGAKAAIFLSLVQVGNPAYTGTAGILVYDQSPGQPASQRIIPYDVAQANNAGLYAAVNVPSSPNSGSSGTPGMEPDLLPNPQGANKVRAACIAAYPANTGNCSGFVTAVGKILGVTISGNADAMTAALKAGGPWTVLSSGAAAAAAAKAGQLVVGGLIGAQCSPPQHHGHVVVVVDGPVLNGLYPTAYWGSLGYIPKAYATVNLTWTHVDLPKVTYAAMTLPG